MGAVLTGSLTDRQITFEGNAALSGVSWPVQPQ